MNMDMTLLREGDNPLHNYGVLLIDGVLFGHTLEDRDRFLESGGVKIHGQTAIPRGRYQVVLSMSKRFGRVMPEVLGVPQFTGVRIHGGNKEEDTDGCPLLGAVRTSFGVANCYSINERLIGLLEGAEKRGEESWLEVD